MSEYSYDAIEIDETHRVRVEYDIDASNPRTEWDHITGALTVRGSSNTIDVEPVHEFPGDLAAAYERTPGDDHRWLSGGGEIAIRWAKIFYGITVEFHNGTFWWCDPEQFAANFEADEFGLIKRIRLVPGSDPAAADYEGYRQTKAECEHEIITGERETYEAWCSGQVYGVIIEERAHITATNDAGDVLSESDGWVEGESCWGYYLDPDVPEREQFIGFAREIGLEVTA